MDRKGSNASLHSSFDEEVSLGMSSSYSPAEGITSNVQSNTAQLLQNDLKVRKIRKMAIVALAIAAVTVCVGVYTSLRGSERKEFEHRFADQAEQIGHALAAELDNKIRALDALSVTKHCL